MQFADFLWKDRAAPAAKDPDMAAAAGVNAPAMISANGEVDLGNVDLSQMDPEVIRVSDESKNTGRHFT